MTGERLRAGTFTKDGRGLVAVGAYGLYNFTNGVWSALRSPRGVDAPSVRGLARLPGGELLLYGDGCAVTLRGDGRSASIDPAAGDATWLGAVADERGVLLVGERRSRPAGVVALLPEGGRPAVRDIDGTTRLHGVARLDAGAVLVCGAHGALLAIDGDEVVEIVWGRTGHLYAATAAQDGGAYVVGSGGHAISITPPHPSLRGVAPPATLEAVQTTRDLTTVIVDASGTAVAAGAQGRLLVRRAGTWSRVNVDATTGGLIAIAAPPRARRLAEVIALADDGAVVEVALA